MPRAMPPAEPERTNPERDVLERDVLEQDVLEQDGLEQDVLAGDDLVPDDLAQDDLGGTDLPTELGREHAAIGRLSRVVATHDRSTERAALVRELADRYLGHAAAERRHLYPPLRRHLPQGASAVVDQERRERAVTRLVESIERTDEFDATVDALVAQFLVDIRRHVEELDGTLLPALVAVCPPEELDLLGREIRRDLRAARAVIPST